MTEEGKKGILPHRSVFLVENSAPGDVFFERSLHLFLVFDIPKPNLRVLIV